MKDFFTQIDAYLDEELSAEERTEFESALAQDVQLQEELNTHRLEREAVLLMLQQDFKTKIKTWRAEESQESTSTTQAEAPKEAKVVDLQKKTPAKRVSLIRRLSIAASLLLLIGFGASIWNGQNYSNSALADNYYMLADTGGDKGGTASVEADFQTGLTAFVNEKNYTRAIAAFEKIPTNSPQYIEAQYYLGHAFYQSKNYNEAAKKFEMVLSNDSLPAFLNRTKIEWNQILALLAAGQTDATFEQKLNKIATDGQAPFKQKAQELQTEMNSIWRNFSF